METDRKLFSNTLRKRVDEYFFKKNISNKGNNALYIKTVFWLTVWFGLYIALIFTPIAGAVKLALLCPLLGMASAGIGFNIMHDASHGAYAKQTKKSIKSKINTLFALTLELLGPSSFIWFTKHVTIHHSLVNTERDDDIVAGKYLRFSPTQPWYSMHRYQHIYAWFLYGLLAIQWIYIADYRKIISGKVHTHNLPGMEVVDILIFLGAKACNLVLFIVLPIWLYGWIALVGLFIYLFVVGLLISVVFQLAHVHEHATFEQTNDRGKLEKEWSTHQVYETLDFSTKNSILTWFLGGLNFQVVHHLFPDISHVHYPALQPIVKKTCREFNIPYIELTFWGALKTHARHLKELGRHP